jgi:hydrogenase maturation protease
MNEWEWNLLEDKTSREQVEVGGTTVRPGDRVRLHPKEGGDILDIALRGQLAIVESVEEDYEGAQHICVVLDADPGRDLGMMRQPGHRFFFTPAELEPIEAAPTNTPPREQSKSQTPSVLVACIGNIFLGDDGFGVEVARRLLARPQRDGVRVIDFGIRGFDLAYALQDGHETTILVDAYPHGQKPGTVSLVEPDLSEIEDSPAGFIQPHAMNPVNVLRMAKAMNGSLRRVLLLGCEPENLGGEEGHLGLSPVVEAAIEHAVNEIELIVNRIMGHPLDEDLSAGTPTDGKEI